MHDSASSPRTQTNAKPWEIWVQITNQAHKKKYRKKNREKSARLGIVLILLQNLLFRYAEVKNYAMSSCFEMTGNIWRILDKRTFNILSNTFCH